MCEPERPGERVAFLCLGAMGAPMAGHLARAGHDVVVYNRSASRAEAWLAEHGGRQAELPAAAAAGARFVFACTGADPDLRAITLGAGAPSRARDRRGVRGPHHRVSRPRARARGGGGGARRRVPGRARLGWPGRRAARRAHRHGGRRARGPRARASVARGLREERHLDGACRRRPAHQAREPDLPGRPDPVAGRGPGLRRARGPRRAPRGRGDLAGRGPVLADGSPRREHARGPLRLRLRGGLDAQGPRARPRRGRALRRAAAGRRAWWTASMPSSSAAARDASTARAW